MGGAASDIAASDIEVRLPHRPKTRRSRPKNPRRLVRRRQARCARTAAAGGAPTLGRLSLTSRGRGALRSLLPWLCAAAAAGQGTRLLRPALASCVGLRRCASRCPGPPAIGSRKGRGLRGSHTQAAQRHVQQEATGAIGQEKASPAFARLSLTLVAARTVFQPGDALS